MTPDGLLGALGTLAEVGPKLAKAAVAPFAALDLHLRYRGRRVLLRLKDGSVIEGILLGQGLGLGAHSLRVEVDRGDVHTIPLGEVAGLVVLREARLTIVNPGAARVGFGLFLAEPRQDLPELAEAGALTRSRVRREELLPGLVTLAFLDAPWTAVSLEIGEPSEMEEPPMIAMPPPPPTFESLRGSQDLALATQSEIASAVDRMRELHGILVSRIRSEGIAADPMFYVQVQTVGDVGLADPAARFLLRLDPSLDAASVDLFVESAGVLVAMGRGRTTFVERGTGDTIRRITR
jgi:hypothetical protein